MLSDLERQEIKAELQHYEQKRAACITALKIVQRHRGWVSDESIHDIAGLLEMTPDELDGVATFRKPVGRHVILLCDSVSCWIMGYMRLREHLQAKVGIGFGETSRDGQFTLLPSPCLGTCDHAPALMVGDDLYKDLTPEKLNEVLDRYRLRRDGDGTTAHPEHQTR